MNQTLRKIICIGLALLSLASLAACGSGDDAASAQTYSVGIVQFMDHPSLNQITDNSPSKAEDNVANELLSLVYQTSDGEFHITSPAKFLDLVPPSQFAKDVETPAVQDEEQVIQWAFEHITEPLLKETETRVQDDNNKRREYLETAFEQVILDLSLQINELQGKAFLSDRTATMSACSIPRARTPPRCRSRRPKRFWMTRA